MFGTSRRVDRSLVPPGPSSRDVEALEQVVLALDGVTDEADAYRLSVESWMASTQAAYGAVWTPDDGGELRLRFHNGGLTDRPGHAGAPSGSGPGTGRDRLPALRRRRPARNGQRRGGPGARR